MAQFVVSCFILSPFALVFEAGYKGQSGLIFTMYLRITLAIRSSCLCLPNAGIIGLCHHTWFMWYLLIHLRPSCSVGSLPTKLHPSTNVSSWAVVELGVRTEAYMHKVLGLIHISRQKKSLLQRDWVCPRPEDVLCPVTHSDYAMSFLCSVLSQW